MNPEIKAKWVEALRSGKYQQGTGRLCWNGEHCCLGVLYDIAQPGGMTPEVGECELLPSSFGAKVGLPFSQEDNLARLNDWERKSFAEIADYIEANL